MLYKLTQSLDIKNLFPVMGQITGLREGSCIQISSPEASLYTLYTPDPKVDRQGIRLSREFMVLNSIPEGYYQVQSCLANSLRTLKIEVSKLQWDIIGDRMSVIQREFFNQVRIVWNGLIVPLYYTQTEKVILRCACEEGVWQLQENSQLHISYSGLSQDGSLGQKPTLLEDLVVQPIMRDTDRVLGFDDELYVAEEVITRHGLEEGNYYQVVEDSSKSTCPTSFKKHIQASVKGVPTSVNYVRIQRSLIAGNAAFCSGFYMRNFHLEPRVRVLANSVDGPQCLSIGSQYFLSSECKIRVFLIPVRQRLSIGASLGELYNRVLDQTCMFYDSRLIKTGGQFYLVKLEMFEKPLDSGVNAPIQALRINNTKQYESRARQKPNQTISDKIKLSTYSVYLASTSELERSNYDQIVNLELLRKDQSSQNQALCRMFQQSYQQEMVELLGCVGNKSIAVVRSSNKNGKTMLNWILNHRRVKTFYLDLEEISNSSGKLADILDYLQLVFQQYSDKVLYLDNVDSMCKTIQSDLHRQDEVISSKVISRRLRQFIETYATNLVVLTTCSLEMLDEQLTRMQFIQVHLKNPTGEFKRAIIQQSEHDSTKINEIAKHAEGFSFAEVISKISNREKVHNFYAHQVLKADTKEEEHNFGKVAGLEEAKKVILETIQTPYKYYSLFKNIDVKLPRGILLYGPSGVGKTFLANAVRDQMKMHFFEVKGSDILNKYIGASEQAVRDIFEKAASVSPSVIFFDQFQSIVPRRNAGNTGVNDRVVNQFLCYLDGVSTVEGVFIIAATSRPEMIDPALLRPGRIDKHVYIEYPDEREREQVLRMFEGSIVLEFQREYVVASTQDYSYSDMIGLIKELRIKKANQVTKKEKIEVGEFKNISKEFFDQIHSSYRIAVGVEQQSRQRVKYQKFANKQPQDIQKQRTTLA